MNKNHLNILLLLTVLLLIGKCFYSSTIITQSLLETMQIFTGKVFPFLFIMMILNHLLIDLNFPYYISKLLPHPYLYLFIMSALCGSPINAVLINSLLNNNTLSQKQASYALCFTTLNNPLFLYTQFIIIFNNQVQSIKLLVIIYLSNILILTFLIVKERNLHIYIPYHKFNFQKTITKAISTSISTLIKIFAIIAFFKLICDLLITSSNPVGILSRGIIEITQGLIALQKVNLSSKIKELLVVVILSFSGFSIHIQISDILSNQNIDYKYFYLSRIILIVISMILVGCT